MSAKKIITIVVFGVAFGAGLYFWAINADRTPILDGSFFDAKNSSFEVDGISVLLTDGLAEEKTAPESASKTITRYFGNEAIGDLNGDGKEDAAFVITRDGGGSGVFYYVVAAIRTDAGYDTTGAFFLGDRIAPQSSEIRDGKLYVNYAERKEGEPMSENPSVGATKTLVVTSGSNLEEE